MPRQEALVVACDLEGYSRLPARAQLSAFRGLQRVVGAALGLARGERPPPQTPVIPTGDGVIVCFLRGADGEDDSEHDDEHDDEHDETAATDPLLRAALGLVADVLAWAADNAALLRGRGVTVGIADGAIHRIRDINGHDNICGRAINMAARVQAAAAPWTVLVTQALWDDHVGRGERLALPRGGAAVPIAAVATVRVHAKHEVELPSYRVAPQGLPAGAGLPGWRDRPLSPERPEVYVAAPRSHHPDAAPLLAAVVQAIRDAGGEPTQPPARFSEEAVRKRLTDADAVIALVIAYDAPAGATQAGPTSAWVLNTIGAARGGVAKPLPTLVLAQAGVDNFGWGHIRALGPDAKFRPDDPEDLDRVRRHVADFVEGLRSGEIS